MTNKFEQLIEYVINDEAEKAQELFHDIVVEKSREIYENLMNEEEMDECDGCHKPMNSCVCEDEEELDESKEEDSEEDSEELDESEEEMDESAMGGDASDNLIDDVEAEEEGMEMHENDETEHDIEDRVVDLEDKLDELMAEFESLMGGEEHHGDAVADIDGGDALEMDDTDTEEFSDEDGEEEESDSEEFDMMENVKLDAAPKPVTSEPAGTNTKSTVAFNSGAKGMQGAPVKMTGDTAQGRSAPKSGDLPEAGQFKNVPGKGGSNAKLAPAPKPVTAQAAGVNTKTPFPKG